MLPNLLSTREKCDIGKCLKPYHYICLNVFNKFHLTNFQIPLYDDRDYEGLDVAGQLLRLANSHNTGIDDTNGALQELVALPKATFGQILFTFFFFF